MIEKVGCRAVDETDDGEERLVAVPCPRCGLRIEKPLSWWGDVEACPHCLDGGQLMLISHLFKVYMESNGAERGDVGA